ncbi:MAG: tyrosine-type recombinase/integrase [Dehalococcoidia bacterium]
MLERLDDFLHDLEANSYSPETVYNYRRDLEEFDRFLSTKTISFDGVDRKAITGYKAYLASNRRGVSADRGRKPTAGKRLSGRSINRMLSSLRSYLRFLIEIEGTSPVPPDSVKLIKTEKRESQVAELPDLVRLIEAPTSVENDPKVALRNRAVLEVLFATGMRISELVGLDRHQVDERGRIYILGKGKKRRFVYLTPRAQHHLRNYLSTRTDELASVFVPYRGGRNGEKGDRLSANYVQSKIKEYREKLGIAVPTTAHSLRHGFATYLAEEGANPAAIQILLGHESLNTTNRYVHASDQFAEYTHRNYHPLPSSVEEPLHQRTG